MLTVADHGIGMTHDRIRNYFLQVGQSFYRSPEFKENYTFEPGSRFGVGFLSVFAESSDVSVETRADHPDAEPIRLRLTGVRNYLLTERGNRTTPGTTVEILLNDALDSYELVQAVKAWCRFVEVPIDLKTPNHEIRIEAERAQEFEASAPVIGTEGATMAVRAFPAEIPGIEGSLYVFEYRDADGADWTAERWARNTYLNRQPGAVVPPRPASVTCFQGIATDGLRIDSEGSSVRVDVRQEVADMPLTREPGQATRAAIARKIEGRWAALITEHLDTEPRGHGPLAWRYKHRLMQKFDEVDAFWMAMADTTPFWHGEDRMGSVTDVAASESLASAVMLEDLVRVLGDVEYVDGVIMWPFDVPSLGPMTLGYASRIARAKLFAGRVITKVVRSGDAVVALWRKGDRAAWAMRRLYGGQQADAVSLGDIGLIGFRFHQADDSTYPRCVLNSDHPFIEWWIRAMTACDAGLCGLRPADGDRLHALLMTPVFYQGYELTALSEYLERWAQLPGLDTDLVPPSWDLGQEAFEARRLSGLASDEP